MVRRSLLACFALGGLTGAGPIASFEREMPVADYETTAKLEDVERCMLDVDGWFVPSVYSQPDRPDEVMLLWLASPSGGGKPIARIDLRRVSGGTAVKIWMPHFRHPEKAARCAPH